MLPIHHIIAVIHFFRKGFSEKYSREATNLVVVISRLLGRGCLSWVVVMAMKPYTIHFNSSANIQRQNTNYFTQFNTVRIIFETQLLYKASGEIQYCPSEMSYLQFCSQLKIANLGVWLLFHLQDGTVAVLLVRLIAKQLPRP